LSNFGLALYFTKTPPPSSASEEALFESSKGGTRPSWGGAVSLISGKKYQQYITYITILVGVISQLMEVTIIVIPCYTH